MSTGGETGTTEHVVDAVRASGARKVKVAITDIDGVLRGKYIHIDKFLSAAEKGFGFCNVVFGWDSADVCYENGVQFTGWHTGYPDADVQLDPSTYRNIPWEGDQPFVLGDFVHADGGDLEVCPRRLLRRMVRRAADMGYRPKYGLEFEFFNFRETPQSLHAKGFQNLEPITPGMFGYSLLRASQNQPYFADLMDMMGAFGVPIEGLHTETGPGVYEAAIQVADAVEAADRAVLFKSGVKEIAYRHGIIPTFMAKWNTALPGSSGHIHQSLLSLDDGRNVFHVDDAPNGMSPLFHHFLAGQMKLMPELLPMLAPTVNSYKRLVEGMWAPTRMTWGVENRTVAFRVIPGSAKSTRLETRVGGADLNPYLGVAAALAAGLYGIEQKLELDSDPITGNGYEAFDAVRLPANLHEATERFERSETARALFGDAFVDHFAKTRHWEWAQSQAAVTQWELARYFEII
jgi:glutamine synthetase